MDNFSVSQKRVFTKGHAKRFPLSFIIAGFLLFVAGFSGHAVAENEGVFDSSTAIISNIVVNVRDFVGDKREWSNMARSLILMREGETYCETRLKESMESLQTSKRFREITVDLSKEKDGVALIFHVSPRRFIKDIKIRGQYPLFKREILNAMTIYPGNVFIEEEFQEQAAFIETLLKRQGFPSPTVRVTYKITPEDRFFVVYVDIEKGPYSPLKRLEITGNRAFSDMTLKLKLSTWRSAFMPGSSGRFIEEKLKKDIRKLTRYYWKKGYPDVHIDFTVQKDAGERGVSILVVIDEGSQYDIEFVSNEEFWDMTLRKDLILFKKGNRDRLGLKKTVRKIKERYKKAGYLHASVKVEEGATRIDDEKTIRPFRFIIDEGPRSIVRAIDIVGNAVFDDEKIKRQMLTRLPGIFEKGLFIPETFEEDLIAVKGLYLKYGYMDAQVKGDVVWSPDKSGVTLSIVIEEGVQILISSVEFTGTTVLSTGELYDVIQLKEGEPFRKYMIRSDENALSALISEKGYPHVGVKGEFSISQDRSKAELIYTIDEGQHVIIGQIYYTGNLRTRKNILDKEFEIEPGTPFSLAHIVEGQRNIRNLDILNSVQFKTIGLKEKRERVDIFVEVEEKEPYYVEAGGGYESQRGFFVDARTGDHNLFGRNKDGWLEGELSQIGYRAEAGIKEPRFLGSRISAAFILFSERTEEFNQDFGAMTYGSSLGFRRKWFQHITTGLNFSLERKEQFSLDSKNVEPETIESESDQFDPRTIQVTTPSINFDTRDSFVCPKKGVFSSFSIDISKGIENSLDDFLKYRFDIRSYVSPLSWLTFAFLGRAGQDKTR